MHKCNEAINQGVLGNGCTSPYKQCVPLGHKDISCTYRLNFYEVSNLPKSELGILTLTRGLFLRSNDRQHSQVAEHNVLGFIMQTLRHGGGG